MLDFKGRTGTLSSEIGNTLSYQDFEISKQEEISPLKMLLGMWVRFSPNRPDG